MRVYHGDIVTVNSNDDVFQYLVENRGRIIYVGNDLPAKYSKAEDIELGTRAHFKWFQSLPRNQTVKP